MRSRLAVLGLLVATVLSGCGGKSASDLGSPSEALAKARQTLSDTSGVQLSLSTGDLPDGVQGIKAAQGVVTDAPAFDGTLTVALKAGQFPVPVRAVGGKVYAQIPLTPGWSEVNPADYGAPDPSQLISDDQGLPAILAATTDPQQGDQVRGGQDNKDILTTYTGSVPGDAVAHIIPGASGDFGASYELDSGGQLVQAALTGVFYSGSPSMTYTLTLSDYGTTQDITAP